METMGGNIVASLPTLSSPPTSDMALAIRRLSVLPSRSRALHFGCVTGVAKPLISPSSSLSSSSSSSSSPIENNEPSSKKNIKLEAIKSVGITQLVNHTQDLITRARQPLFEDDPVDENGHTKQSIAQIQESTRMESAILDALSHYSSRHNTFSVGGQCIEVLGVEVTPDLKTAKTYWCLPRSLDLHAIPDIKIKALITRMQQQLTEQGGKIQGLAHARLRAYHPPKIVWVPAEHVSKDLMRGASFDGAGGNKKQHGRR